MIGEHHFTRIQNTPVAGITVRAMAVDLLRPNSFMNHIFLGLPPSLHCRFESWKRIAPDLTN